MLGPFVREWVTAAPCSLSPHITWPILQAEASLTLSSRSCHSGTNVLSLQSRLHVDFLL